MQKELKSNIGFIASCLGIVALSLGLAAAVNAPHRDEDWLRDRVVKLVSDQGSCSGEQVRAPSGTDYILTAAHCRVLAKDGEIEVQADNGRHMMRRVLAEDATSDLLLLEGLPALEGVQVANSLSPRQNVITLTHGHGFDTYRTEGAVVQLEYRIQVMIGEADEKCSGAKYKKAQSFFGEVCVMDVVETVSIAMTAPGSSGGMVVDEAGQLVGVVSAGDEKFSLFVTLKDIKSFLYSY